MFALVTISNGLAVVQHAPTGRVYRFRPVHPGVWSRLTLQGVDDGDRGDAPRDHESAARQFAEETATACCATADPCADLERPSRLRSLFSFGTSRPLGQA